MRWAFPTAIDYYGVLRPRITTSGTATPAFFKAGDAGSPVSRMYLFLDLGFIYTPEVLSCRLHLCTAQATHIVFGGRYARVTSTGGK